jgi:hypothetical protein
MAIFGSIFAMLGRFAGRLLNSALGWATLLLFGKVEGRRQTLLLVIALGSLLWVLTLVGVVLPDVGAFLIAFVPLPEFVDDNLVRLAMLGAAILLPLLIGAGAIVLTSAEQRPKGAGIVGAVLRGYPFTLVLALTIVLLAAVSLVRKVQSLSRRWEDAHVPVVVKPGGYETVLQQLEQVLDEAGVAVERRPAPSVLSIPPRLLDRVAGRALGSLVPDRLMLLVGDGVEVLVYPSDVAIAGQKSLLARARAAIASKLTEAPAYLTTSAEAERVEDRIREVADLPVRDPIAVAAAQPKLDAIDGQLAELTVPFDEWETVYRERLQVERDMLRGSRDHLGTAGEPRRSRSLPVERLVGLAGIALIAIDAVLLLAERLRPARVRRQRR